MIKISEGTAEVVSAPSTIPKVKNTTPDEKRTFFLDFYKEDSRWKPIKTAEDYQVSGLSRLENLTSHRVLI